MSEESPPSVKDVLAAMGLAAATASMSGCFCSVGNPAIDAGEFDSGPADAGDRDSGPGLQMDAGPGDAGVGMDADVADDGGEPGDAGEPSDGGDDGGAADASL